MKNKKNKNSKKVLKKKHKKVAIFSSLLLMGTVVASVAASCGKNDTDQIFREANATNYLQTNNSPLNPTFANSPISSSVANVMLGLLTYETTGSFEFSPTGDPIKTTESSLKLEAASQVELLDENGVPLIDDDGKPIVYKRDGSKINENDAAVQKAQAQAYAYRFTIDTNMKWVDKDGVVMDYLSGKDFERGLETYALSSIIGYNRNGYFMGLVGINFEKTAGYINPKNGEYVSVDSVEYDINNYRNSDETFTLYLKAPYPYTLSILTKDFFNPLPHNNPYVQNIKISTSNSPLAVNQEADGTKVIDQQNTNWDQIYGSGQVGTFLENTWFAGAYYVTRYSRNQIVSILNDAYMDTVGPSLDQKNGKKIKTYLVDFGSGNPEVYYERFIAKQISVAEVPQAKRSDAIQRFLDKGLYVSSIVKTPKSTYIAYTPYPYRLDKEGRVSLNWSQTGTDTISTQAAQMIYNWNSKESVIIRTGLSGLINHYQLSKLNIPNGDFQYSNIPYGVFDLSGVSNPILKNYSDYYKAVDNNELYGGLPRAVKDYGDDNDYDEYSVFTGNKASFSIPYYSFNKQDGTNKNTVHKENLTVDKTSFINALKAFGATANKPFALQYKYGEGSITDNYDNYLKALQRAIEQLGTENGIKYLTFSLVNRNAPNPSAEDWYQNRSSSMGYSNWNPDYNAVGTWLEANSTLDDKGLPESNNHSFFGTLIWTLLLNAVDLNVQLNLNAYENNSSTAAFATADTTTTTSIFANDPRMNKVYANQEYSQKGIEFLNFLVKNKVLNKQAIADIMKNNPNQILQELSSLRSTPNSKRDLYPLLSEGKLSGGQSIFNPKSDNLKDGHGEGFGKYLGEWSGLNPDNALWLTITMDNGYFLLPRSESGIRDKIYTLVDPKFLIRTASVGPANVRDYQVN